MYHNVCIAAPHGRLLPMNESLVILGIVVLFVFSILYVLVQGLIGLMRLLFIKETHHSKSNA